MSKMMTSTKKCQGCSVVVQISKPPTTMVGNPSHFVEKHGDMEKTMKHQFGCREMSRYFSMVLVFYWIQRPCVENYG